MNFPSIKTISTKAVTLLSAGALAACTNGMPTSSGPAKPFDSKRLGNCTGASDAFSWTSGQTRGPLGVTGKNVDRLTDITPESMAALGENYSSTVPHATGGFTDESYLTDKFANGEGNGFKIPEGTTQLTAELTDLADDTGYIQVIKNGVSSLVDVETLEADERGVVSLSFQNVTSLEINSLEGQASYAVAGYSGVYKCPERKEGGDSNKGGGTPSPSGRGGTGFTSLDARTPRAFV